MKKTVRVKKILFHSFPGLAVVCFMLVSFSAAAKNNGAAGIKCSCIPYCDTIVVSQYSVNKKHNIRLYPDANKQVLLVSANSRQQNHYQFYMFDMDGKLVKQGNILNRETTVFDNIFKGNYLFEIFSNDERIENGQLTVR